MIPRRIRDMFAVSVRAARSSVPPMPVLAAMALGVWGLILLSYDASLWWLGASACIGSILTLWHTYRASIDRLHTWIMSPRTFLGHRVVLSAWILDLSYVAVIVGIATVMLADLFDGGGRPVSHDHTIHYFNAWQLHEHFLSHGKLHGWSNRWFAGYPAHYLYPVGASLLINLVHFLALGTLSFSSSYAVAFWLFHALTGYAGYRFGRVVGGPHVGFITGLLLITDMSSFRLGGWAYSIEYGVWPQSLSLAFSLLAVVRMPAIYEQRRLRDIGIFALWMGAAIVTHPVQLVNLGMLFAAAVLAGVFSPGIQTAVGSFRLLVAYALAITVSAIWLLPFLSVRSETTPMGVWWDSTYELGKGLLNLNAFPGTVGYVLILGMLGAMVMLRSRGFALMFTAFVAILVPAVSNSTFIDEFHLASVSSGFLKIQWLRMSTMIKPFWFAMAGYLPVAMFTVRDAFHSSAPNTHRPTRTPLREGMLGMLVSLLVLPIMVSAVQAFVTSNILKSIKTEVDRGYDPDREALVEWLRTKLPHDGFYRLCINGGENHDLMDIATEIPVPIYKRGFTPAENFIYKMSVDDPTILEAVNVRYMVAKKWMPEDNYELVATFGPYRVFRFKRWNPRPFVVSRGHGQVTLERFGDEEIVLRAAPGSSGELRLNISYFPRWHAYRDGKPIGITKTSLPKDATHTGFMTVALSPGQYRFVFEYSLADHLAGPLSALGILVALFFIAADGRKSHVRGLRVCMDAISARLVTISSQRFAPAWIWAGAAISVVMLVSLICLAEWTPRLALEELDGLVVRRVNFDFLERLSTARAAIRYTQVFRPCKRQGDRFVCRDEAGNLDNEKYVGSSPAEILNYRMVRCIRARPEQDAELMIEYPRVPVGQAIVGYYLVEHAGRLMRLTRPVDFKVLIDRNVAYAGSTRSDSKLHWFKAPVEHVHSTVDVMFKVSAHNVAKRYFCFYAQMVDLAKPKERRAPDALAPKRDSEDGGELSDPGTEGDKGIGR